MRGVTRSRPTRRRGAAAVELALCLPLFLILISGLWEIGRLVEVQQIASNAAREGGRQASTALMDADGIKQVVTEYLQTALNDNDPSGQTGKTRAQNAVITVQNLTSNDSSASPPRSDPTGAQQLDQFQITVALPFKDVRWVSLALVTNDTTQVSGTAVWYSMRDKSYPAPPTPTLQ